MSDWKDTEYVCGCCGSRFQDRVLSGSFVPSKYRALDLNPHDDSAFESVRMCPHCGYAAENIEKAADEGVKKRVAIPQYQSIANSDIDPRYKKNYLAGLLKMADQNFLRAGELILAAAWVQESLGLSAKKLRMQAAECLNLYLNTEVNITAAMILLDCLRRVEEFEDAEELARFLSSCSVQPFEAAVLRFERKLIEQHDSMEHLLEEVPE